VTFIYRHLRNILTYLLTYYRKWHVGYQMVTHISLDANISKTIRDRASVPIDNE